MSERKYATFDEWQITQQPEERRVRKFVQAVHSIRAERERTRNASKKRSREHCDAATKLEYEKHAVATRAHKKCKLAIEGTREKRAKAVE